MKLLNTFLVSLVLIALPGVALAQGKIAVVNLEEAILQTDLAQQRLAATERLADAERKRLREGASDVLVVNLRELDVAKAAVDAVDAALEVNRSMAQLLFARGIAGIK